MDRAQDVAQDDPGQEGAEEDVAVGDAADDAWQVERDFAEDISVLCPC